jgi:hypothetical protein
MKQQSEEATALATGAEAAREVQAASSALEQHFDETPGFAPSSLQLARFAATMKELKDAREARQSVGARSLGR